MIILTELPYTVHLSLKRQMYIEVKECDIEEGEYNEHCHFLISVIMVLVQHTWDVEGGDGLQNEVGCSLLIAQFAR